MLDDDPVYEKIKIIQDDHINSKIQIMEYI